MDQIICASLSHTQYLYEVGMLKVLASMCAFEFRVSSAPSSPMPPLNRKYVNTLFISSDYLTNPAPVLNHISFLRLTSSSSLSFRAGFSAKLGKPVEGHGPSHQEV